MQTSAQESIASLIAQCAAATPAGADWSALAERLTPRLRGAIVGTLTLCRVPRRAELIEELVQETWCRLLAGERRALRRFRGRSELEAAAYLRRIASTIVLDRVRNDAAAKRDPSRVQPLDGSLGAEARLDDRRGCPERRLLARERMRRLASLCGELVGSRRRSERLAIARLSLVEGMSSREIVARLGDPWTVGRVNSFLFRLRRRLAARGVRLPVRDRGTGA